MDFCIRNGEKHLKRGYQSKIKFGIPHITDRGYYENFIFKTTFQEQIVGINGQLFLLYVKRA